MHRNALAAVLVAVSLANTLVLARAQDRQRPAVTFKVDINFVEVDTVVTDAQGRFVRGLAKDDFELLEDGVPQAVTAFSAVDLPVERRDTPSFKEAPIEPDVESNLAPFDGRVFLIVLDDLQTDVRRTARVRAAARQFVRRFVGANDAVAVVHTGSGPRSAQDFTSNPRLLLAAIDKFAGRKLPSATQMRIDDFYVQRALNSGNAARDTAENERIHFARNSLQTVRSAAEFLASLHGRRKAVVWFSEGVDYFTGDPVAARSSSVIGDEVRQTIAAATRAGVTIYAMDARGLGAGLDEAVEIRAFPGDPGSDVGGQSLFDEVRRSQDFLRTVSEDTGGFAIVNRNDANEAFERIVRDNSSYYLLGYYSSNARRDGTFRKVEVRVKRPGLEVRSRAGYTAPKGTAAASAMQKASGESGASPELRAALESPLPVTGLGLRVFAAPFAGPRALSSLAIVVEIAPQRLSFVEKQGVYSEEIELVMVPVDDSGAPREGGRDRAPMHLSRPNYELVRASGLRLARRLDVRPGRYRLRIAARAANSGAVGALFYDVDVPDFTKSTLALSGIAVTSPRAAQMPTPQPAKEFLDLIREVPTASRDFARGDTLTVSAQVYVNRWTNGGGVELATTVRAEDGKVMFNASDVRKREELGARAGSFEHTAKVPLADMPGGRYVLRVEAKTTKTDGAVAREIEFRVRER